ncbi:MAG: ABC transporter permease [Chloroflexi bacterium]|nr:ABC transporter permease [Chloroflexota bacterium]
MSRSPEILSRAWERLKGWEGLLLVLFLVIVAINAVQAPAYLSIANQINLFQLSIEKIIVALVMTFIIINAEIDLSVASMMGLSACFLAWLFQKGVPVPVGLLAGLLLGVVGGAFNGFWVAIVGLPSLVVTLATLIMYRGLARVLLEDRSIGNFPEWFDALGQQPLIGPFPLAMIIFFVFLLLAIVILQYSGFGRYVYVIGNSSDVARYSGVRVRRIKMILFTASSTIAALTGLLFAARLGAVRGDLANGFELDIITMVLLGGVSIFGGSGSLFGVLLSILIVLNLRNGMSLANITGHVQTGVIGVLLILSVLVPNLASQVRTILNRRRRISRPQDTSA